MHLKRAAAALLQRSAAVVGRRLSLARRFSVTHCSLRFLLVFICLCFLLHLRTAFLSFLLLSNSIHERCTLHHSVSLYLFLSSFFFMPFCTRAKWRRKGRRRGWWVGEMDRLGDSDKGSISRPSSPGRTTPRDPPSISVSPHLHSILLLFHSTHLLLFPLFFVAFRPDKGSLRIHFVCTSACKCLPPCVYACAHLCLSA